jgi:hypothetical protein
MDALFLILFIGDSFKYYLVILLQLLLSINSHNKEMQNKKYNMKDIVNVIYVLQIKVPLNVGVKISCRMSIMCIIFGTISFICILFKI